MQNIQILEEAAFIMDLAEAIMGQTHIQQLPTGTILQGLEQRMDALAQEMIDLGVEDVHDGRIAEAIWEATWEP
ncbi:hypothetical protein N7471_008683 [Penicillium samsonianum]|uniref:uncharacterized protein n=1 Tax=Penicillium samsonianum TaxID=1882272 RepID=UPI00254969B5|nr:uncharacterized protein N7471_008683 [Penicillium samsonianum]KAJ6133468.1 hypothetical protein N7471_008683 [Penicillium samsonianum]